MNYPVNRDIASGQEICNRGIETYRGTPEKQEIGRAEVGFKIRLSAARRIPRSQVVLSGNFVVDKWRNSPLPTPPL